MLCESVVSGSVVTGVVLVKVLAVVVVAIVAVVAVVALAVGVFSVMNGHGYSYRFGYGGQKALWKGVAVGKSLAVW